MRATASRSLTREWTGALESQARGTCAPGELQGVPFLFDAAPDRRLHLFLGSPRFLQRLIDTEAARLLARRKILEGLEKLGHQRLRGNQQEHAICSPLLIEHGRVFGSTL